MDSITSHICIYPWATTTLQLTENLHPERYSLISAVEIWLTEDCICNYQDQSTNHLVSKCQIILAGTLFNKAFSSLHVTQLDEKLDLEKMVGPILRMSCRNMTENGCGKWREDSKGEDSHSTQNFHPIFLIFKSSLHDTQLDENLIWNGTITIQQSSN